MPLGPLAGALGGEEVVVLADVVVVHGVAEAPVHADDAAHAHIVPASLLPDRWR